MVLTFTDENDNALGFAEASIRTDYVNGTHSSPVAFLEGLYVQPDSRAQGIARRLVAGVEEWAGEMGCTELASDALVENEGSHKMHEALGFEEAEQVVFFDGDWGCQENDNQTLSLKPRYRDAKIKIEVR